MIPKPGLIAQKQNVGEVDDLSLVMCPITLGELGKSRAMRLPTGPSKAISCVCVIFIDSGHGASLPFSGSTTGLSAIDICRAGPWSDGGSTMRLFAFYSEKKAKCLLLADQLPQIEE